MDNNQKYCKHCGELIDKDCIICPKCGKQVEDIAGNSKPIIINNSASSSSSSSARIDLNTQNISGHAKNKWISFLLCLFTVCGHKFYEGKIGMGILYLLTVGLFGIGWIIDLISLPGKSNPYYV